MYNNVEISEKFAEMFRRSRQDAGEISGKYISQEYMAKALGVTKTTIQNWENGTSCPNQFKAFEWFQALGLQPLPYYLRLLYPDTFGKDPRDLAEKEIEDALIALMVTFPLEYKKKLLYWFYGEHGSSPFCILEMVTAHLQTPLQDRLNIAHNIINNYELAVVKGTTKSPDAVQPNIDLLKEAYERGRRSVVDGKDNYSNTGLFEMNI